MSTITNMKGTQSLLLALLVVVSVGTVPGTVAAEDWPDSCDDAPIVEPTGEYDITVSSPNDDSAMKIKMQKGDYIYFSMSTPTGLTVEVDGNPDSLHGSSVSITDISGVEPSDNSRGVVSVPQGSGSSWQVWGERDEEHTYCIRINGGGDEDIPFTSTLYMEKNSPNPPDTGGERSNQLESELEQKNQRISELETQLEQKNERISELESRIEELESRPTPTAESGSVNIQVTVNPTNGQNFVEGGEAVVQAESENADVSEMQVEYGAGTYELDSSGEVAIPLAETGTQEMSLVHGDTTKQLSIDVQAQGGQNQQDQQDTSSTNGPGFGVVVAMIAILGGTLLFGRYR